MTKDTEGQARSEAKAKETNHGCAQEGSWRMRSLPGRVIDLLKTKFADLVDGLETIGATERVIGFVASPDFDGMDDGSRQDKLWDVLRTGLSDSELPHVGPIATLTPAEAEIDISGDGRPVISRDPLSIETTSFVTWLINTQRWRRDPVGYLAGIFARDCDIRARYLNANLEQLIAFLRARNSTGSHVSALRQGYVEWQQAYGWYS